MSEQNSTFERLEDQINWYDQRSIKNQRLYKRLKVIQIIAAAVIPFLAGIGASPYITGGFGVVIVILESLQQLNQYSQNWISYRTTCESLKHEKFLYLAKAGHYATAKEPSAMFAEHVEAIVSQEHAKWINTREHEVKSKDTGDKK